MTQSLTRNLVVSVLVVPMQAQQSVYAIRILWVKTPLNQIANWFKKRTCFVGNTIWQVFIERHRTCPWTLLILVSHQLTDGSVIRLVIPNSGKTVVTTLKKWKKVGENTSSISVTISVAMLWTEAKKQAKKSLKTNWRLLKKIFKK